MSKKNQENIIMSEIIVNLTKKAKELETGIALSPEVMKRAGIDEYDKVNLIFGKGSLTILKAMN